MQGETCKGTVMSRNVLNLSKKKYSILDKETCLITMYFIS